MALTLTVFSVNVVIIPNLSNIFLGILILVETFIIYGIRLTLNYNHCISIYFSRNAQTW